MCFLLAEEQKPVTEESGETKPADGEKPAEGDKPADAEKPAEEQAAAATTEGYIIILFCNFHTEYQQTHLAKAKHLSKKQAVILNRRSHDTFTHLYK